MRQPDNGSSDISYCNKIDHAIRPELPVSSVSTHLYFNSVTAIQLSTNHPDFCPTRTLFFLCYW